MPLEEPDITNQKDSESPTSKKTDDVVSASPLLLLKKKPSLLIAAMFILLSFAAYGINLNGPMIWDDEVWVANNEAVAHWHPGWIWMHKYSSPSYYPLTVTSFWIEYHIWGNWLAGYRIVNILLHSASAYLLWRLLKNMKIPGALLAAAVWAIHPLQVETVVWITERKNTLSGVLFFAALLLWLKIISAPVMNRQEWKRYGWMIVLFLLALTAKTTVVFLPIAALAIALICTGRISKKHFKLSLPLFALALIMGVVTIYVEHHDAAHGYGPAWELSWAQRFILSGRCFWFYITKIFWPKDLITVYPKWPLNVENPADYLWPLSAIALIVALGVLAWRWKKYGPFCAVIIYLAAIFPVIGYMKFFTQLYTYTADHYVYLPCVTIIILAAALLTMAWEKLRARMEHIKLPPRASQVAGGVLVASLTILSVGYSSIYRNNFALWEEVLRVNPNAFIAYSCLGYYHYKAGYHGKAVQHYEKSLTMFRDARVLANAAIILEAHNQLGQAKAYYEEAIADNVYNVDVYKQLAKMELIAGNSDRALEICRKGLEIEPEWDVLWYGIGMIYRQRGENDKALEAFERYLKMVPKAADVYVEIGVIYQERGDVDRAIGYFRDGMKANPEFLGARRNLASALWQKGQTAEATQVAAEADQLEIKLKQKIAAKAAAKSMQAGPAPAAPRI